MNSSPGGPPPDFHYEELHGREVAPVLEELGQLRIAVFRDYPYLYLGDPASERDYLQVYVDSPRSLVVLLRADSDLVGATTCLPMIDGFAEFQSPFREAGFDLGSVCYFGESVILPAWRGFGAGHQFFDRRERHARDLGHRFTTFCAVDRPADHPLRPPAYRPLDSFWTRRGYARRDDLHSEFSWKEIGEEKETPKRLTYWLRDWA